MSKIQISVQGQDEKYESEMAESLDVVSEHIRKLMKDNNSLLLKGEVLHVIIPTHNITAIEISE